MTLLVILFLSFESRGEIGTGSGTDKFQTGLPIHDIFPVPSGIIFPSLLTAAGVNPAGLTNRGRRVSAMGLSYTPAPTTGGSHAYSLSYASGDKKYGWGLGYLGSYGNSATHGLYAGAGFQTELTAIGLSLRNNDIATAVAPETDLGIIIGTKSDITLGLVFYKLQSSPQLDFGIGFGNQKTYNFEINLLLPPLGTVFQSSSDYVVTAATTVYAYIFGLSFRSSYSTKSSQVTQTVSVLIKVMKNVALTVQYQSPNRSYYGLEVAF